VQMGVYFPDRRWKEHGKNKN